jgi:hypothetical protein
MSTRLFLAPAALLVMAATASSLATAGEHPRSGRHPDDAHAHASRTVQGFDHGMQAVPTRAGAGQAGDGWRYFSDPAAHRAVVISPHGDYFLSRGKGMRQIAVTQPQS